ncbi:MULTISPECIES: DUF1992 domain-containing protein [unclassified Nocardioides]|uniref:DnaJ family domain-containing protein n=1 Tax=unclassified Nocardioides TaxID=2615069 RepID=UPI0007033CC1|nr:MULTISPECIES: DUF1992 domain-containing protein [unclassified Nocardioides]KRC52865.1 hypothetical protein ASE19_10670 [Nocardioides sp. Root79]KRC72396.1 hypothetical protein ASE20_07205 [Nocardioides sp. Root240]
MSEQQHEDPAAEAAQRRAAEQKAARARIEQQQTWVDLQVRQAMERGEFDDLPGAGKPIEGLGATHDPDWWVKRLVEREQITVLPPALQLRKDDASLDGELDAMGSEREVRAFVEDFNARVIRARYTPVDGPPLITMPRDVDATVAAWRERAEARRAAWRAAQAVTDAAAPTRRGSLRGWLRRRR